VLCFAFFCFIRTLLLAELILDFLAKAFLAAAANSMLFALAVPDPGADKLLQEGLGNQLFTKLALHILAASWRVFKIVVQA
jgi:hypothetical protein